MAGETGRALVVEDERAWQEILGEVLADMGLVVDLAGSLDEAVASLRAVPHRLAIVDLSLGGGSHHNRDGLQVLEAVRRQDPSCTSLLLTGYATVELAVAALTEYGAFTCLRKEVFRRSQLRDLVRQALAVAPPDPDGRRPRWAAGGVIQVPAEGTTAADGAVPAALLVEDDAGWRDILTELLAECGYRVQTCRSFGEALGCLRRQNLGVAVVDLSLASSISPRSNRDGYQVLAAAGTAGVPAIVVSGMATPADIQQAYGDFGIFACLEKQAFDRAAFRETVTAAWVAGAQQRKGRLVTDGGAAAPDLPALLSGLTPRERDILLLLAQGMTNKDIAATLIISANTVKRYLKSIFKKLNVDTRSAAAALAAGTGLVPRPPRHP